MTEIETILRQETERQGVVPFARFMELALYCPGLGYYEREQGWPGRQGDFYTNVSVGPLFGELLARQFAQWAAETGPNQQALQWVEAGAHDGKLAHDLLSWMQANRPDLLERLIYWVMEPSSRRQAWQRRTLDRFAGLVRWVDSWEQWEGPGVTGVIFSNELLDALPVHRFRWDTNERRWREWGVRWSGDRFEWAQCPNPGQDWSSIFEEAGLVIPAALQDVLPDGFTVDLSPLAATWWRNAAERLSCGRLITIDYGLTAEQLLEPCRAQGTLRAYRKHAQTTDVLAHPGEQDLTAHVNFTQLQRAGEGVGLRTEALLGQAHFLTRLAMNVWGETAAKDSWTPAQVRQFQTLTHPDHLGRAFQVLMQTRDVTAAR